MNTLKLFFYTLFFFNTSFNCHSNSKKIFSYQHGIAMHGDLKYKNFSKFDYANENAFKGGK